jgi:hypothetical protein
MVTMLLGFPWEKLKFSVDKRRGNDIQYLVGFSANWREKHV